MCYTPGVSRWVQAGHPDDVPPGQARSVFVDGNRVALFNVDGEFFAIDDSCPHQGASLGEGTLHDGRVICPLHSWIFDVRTGQCPRGTHEGVRAYATRCEDGALEIELPAD